MRANESSNCPRIVRWTCLCMHSLTKSNEFFSWFSQAIQVAKINRLVHWQTMSRHKFKNINYLNDSLKSNENQHDRDTHTNTHIQMDCEPIGWTIADVEFLGAYCTQARYTGPISVHEWHPQPSQTSFLTVIYHLFANCCSSTVESCFWWNKANEFRHGIYDMYGAVAAASTFEHVAFMNCGRDK